VIPNRTKNSESRNVSVVYRRATLADVPAITEIYNEAILTTTATFDVEPKTVADREVWLHAHDGRFPVIVGAVGKEIAGWASLTPWSERAAYDDTAETALYVHSTYRGRGIGRELNARIIEEARQLKFHTLIARVTEDSDASIHLNEAAGFILVGTVKEVGRKFGRLLDVHVMQKMLN